MLHYSPIYQFYFQSIDNTIGSMGTKVCFLNFFYPQVRLSRILLVHSSSTRREWTCCHHNCFWKRKARGEVRQVLCLWVLACFPPNWIFQLQLSTFFVSLFLFREVIFTLIYWLNVTLWGSFSQFSLTYWLARLISHVHSTESPTTSLVYHRLTILHMNIFPDFLIYPPPLNLVYLWGILMQFKY